MRKSDKFYAKAVLTRHCTQLAHLHTQQRAGIVMLTTLHFYNALALQGGDGNYTLDRMRTLSSHVQMDMISTAWTMIRGRPLIGKVEYRLVLSVLFSFAKIIC